MSGPRPQRSTYHQKALQQIRNSLQPFAAPDPGFQSPSSGGSSIPSSPSRQSPSNQSHTRGIEYRAQQYPFVPSQVPPSVQQLLRRIDTPSSPSSSSSNSPTSQLVPPKKPTFVIKSTPVPKPILQSAVPMTYSLQPPPYQNDPPPLPPKPNKKLDSLNNNSPQNVLNSTPNVQNAYLTSNVQNTHASHNVQNTHVLQNVQNTLASHNVQNTHASHNLQNTHLNSNVQNTHLTQSVNNTHLTSNVQNTHGTNNVQNTHLNQIVQNAHLAQSVKNTHSSQNVQQRNSLQNIHQTQLAQNVQNTQVTPNVKNVGPNVRSVTLAQNGLNTHGFPNPSLLAKNSDKLASIGGNRSPHSHVESRSSNNNKIDFGTVGDRSSKISSSASEQSEYSDIPMPNLNSSTSNNNNNHNGHGYGQTQQQYGMSSLANGIYTPMSECSDMSEPLSTVSSSTNGTNGTNETSGTNRTSDPNDTNGTNVKNGSNGTNGTNVKNGTNGTNSTNVKNSTNGTNGSKITSGTNGIVGPKLKVDISGTNGTGGCKLTNGTNGTISGTNGTTSVSNGTSSGTNSKQGTPPPSTPPTAEEMIHTHESPIPERKIWSREKEEERFESKVRVYSPQAFKFFMEQHVENVIKSHQERVHRRMQLESEMTKIGLSEEAQTQMRRMLSQKESNYIRLKRAKMDKSLFKQLCIIGVGAFGEVALVRKLDTNHLYAMKTLRKSDVLRRNQMAHVKAERDILAEADNEWVVKLYYSFQDLDHLYFVMDYIPGGDLMSLLIKLGVFEESLALFYIAELTCAVESVHRMGFIHRDIKPDNILIDRDGHIKLTDFGLCTGFRWTLNSKYYQESNSLACCDAINKWQICECEVKGKPLDRRKKTNVRCLAHSLVGTPNYIAPEVLMRTGYTQLCDWWSVGVILYEMLVGQPPFLAPSPAETQYKVINWATSLRIPSQATLSPHAKDLILKLCTDHSRRLGKSGANQVKSHPFFSSINFESGLRRGVAPYIPKIRHPTDTSNFDPCTPAPDESGTSPFEFNQFHGFFEFTFRRFFDDAYNEEGGPVYV